MVNVSILRDGPNDTRVPVMMTATLASEAGRLASSRKISRAELIRRLLVERLQQESPADSRALATDLAEDR